MTIDVPDTMTTVAVLLALTSGAIASTFGVSAPADDGDLVGDDQLLGDALRNVGNAGVVPDDQLDLSACDHVAMLRHIEARTGHGLLADGAEHPGQRHHESDFDRFLRRNVGSRAPCLPAPKLAAANQWQ